VSGWAWAWIGFGVYFAAVEGAALAQSYRARRAGAADPRDTLSEHLWFWFGVNRAGTGIERGSNWWARVRRVILGGALLWLAVHLLTGGAYF
jgi:hypothetical protein